MFFSKVKLKNAHTDTISIMKEVVQKKELVSPINNIIATYWLQILLEEALADDYLKFINIDRYITTILDDYNRCLYFTEEHSIKEIKNFISTLII